jgi:hypothetical protein
MINEFIINIIKLQSPTIFAAFSYFQPYFINIITESINTQRSNKILTTDLITGWNA